MSDPHQLQRFVAAQNPVYRQICVKLAAGEKTNHWMWSVFFPRSRAWATARSRSISASHSGTRRRPVGNIPFLGRGSGNVLNACW